MSSRFFPFERREITSVSAKTAQVLLIWQGSVLLKSKTSHFSHFDIQSFRHDIGRNFPVPAAHLSFITKLFVIPRLLILNSFRVLGSNVNYGPDFRDEKAHSLGLTKYFRKHFCCERNSISSPSGCYYALKLIYRTVRFKNMPSPTPPKLL